MGFEVIEVEEDYTKACLENYGKWAVAMRELYVDPYADCPTGQQINEVEPSILPVTFANNLRSDRLMKRVRSWF